MTHTHGRRHAVITVAICFLIAVIEGMDIQAAGIAVKGVAAEFGLDKTYQGYFLSAGILGLLPGSLMGGRWADKYGRKAVLIASVAIFALFTLFTAWVNSLAILLMVRFLAGAGLGAAMPNLITLAAESVQPEHRARAVGMMYAGMPVGAAILSLVAASNFGENWKNIFYLGGLLPLVVIPIMIWLLPESREFLQARQSRNVVQGRFTDLFSNGLTSCTLLLWVSYFFTLMVVYLMLSWLPSLFQELGFSRKQGSTAQFWFMVSATVGTVLLGYLTDRWHKALVIALMYGGILAGLLSLNGASGLEQMYWAAALTGAFVIGCQGVLYAFGGIVYPTAVRATGVGTAAAVGRIGATLGPTIAGMLLSQGYGAAGVISSAIPCIIVSAICMLLVVRQIKQGQALPHPGVAMPAVSKI